MYLKNKDFFKISIYLASMSMMLYGVKLNFSPVYIILIIALFFGLIALFLSNELVIKSDEIIAFILLIYLLATKFDNIGGEFINLALGLSCYIIIRLSSNSINKDIYLTASNLALMFGSAILFFDTVYRLLHPAILDPEALAHYAAMSTEFYVYKFNSLIFLDSNAVAIAALNLFFLSFYLSCKFKTKFYYLFSIVLIIILFTTFSRSAIFASIFFTALVLSNKLNKKYILYLFPIFLYLIWLFFTSVKDDESFGTKFYLYNILFNNFYQDHSILDVLFGINFGDFGHEYNIAAHSVFVTYLTELGSLGFLLFISFLYSVYKRSKISFLYCILPHLTAGLSYFIYGGTPFFYIIIALVINLENIKNNA